MRKDVKTGTVAAAYQVLNTAHYGKLSDAEKIAVWKLLRAMKPVAVEFTDAVHDAEDKLKPVEDYEDRLLLAKEFETLQGKDARMTHDEYFAFVTMHKEYRKTVGEAIKDLNDKEVSLDLVPVGEETFCRLMSSNNWTLEQAAVLGEIITE